MPQTIAEGREPLPSLQELIASGLSADTKTLLHLCPLLTKERNA
jgi:hypothetical protein